ncbi:S41 family peptidase [Desulfolucanica intricata]|uniref:S41 family peptidase n=1 Tax=Desulfolucanica intricata TaxID=1285191 RepID=UPI00082B95DB|nr:S41 family peptidase [Desulfolucanica intricata]
MRKAIFLTVTLLLFLTAQPVFAEDKLSEAGFLFQEILDYVYENHLDEPDLDDLMYGAIDGMLSSLEDPYTEYFTKENLEQFKDSLDGDFVGVGIRLRLKDQLPYVEEVFSGSPALNAGLRAGDVIIKVESKDVFGLPLADVVEMIRGPEGTTVNLTVLRNDTQINFQIIRRAVNIPTISYEMLDKKLGYIVIDSFGSTSAKEFALAMDELMTLGMQSLILDLRNNPGGYLNESVKIAGHFIAPGKTVVSIVNRNGKRDVYRADGQAEAEGMPVAVLVNDNSASASEVLAGALQDYKAAVLVGTQTYGKGVVQSMLPLMDGGALKMTIAKYLTPLEHDLNIVGLKPDFTVLTPSLQFPAAKQIIDPPVLRVTEFSVGQHEVLVNGEEIISENVPFEDLGNVFVPLRFALESLGFEVSWVLGEKGSGIKITGYNQDLFIQSEKKQAILNGKEIVLDSEIRLIDGTSFISANDLKVLNIKVIVNDGKIELEN